MTPEFVAIPHFMDRPQRSATTDIPRFMLTLKSPALTLLAAAILGAFLSVLAFTLWSICQPSMTIDVVTVGTIALTFTVAIILGVGLLLLWANVSDVEENAG